MCGITSVVDPALPSVVAASHPSLAGVACGPVPASGSIMSTDATAVPSPIWLTALSSVCNCRPISGYLSIGSDLWCSGADYTVG